MGEMTDSERGERERRQRGREEGEKEGERRKYKTVERGNWW